VTKVIIIGIILAGIIIGILAVSSLEIFSNMRDNDVSSEPILGKDGEDSGPEPKPPGKNFSIELDEKMGLSSP
jgi:hypothetical protein